jgi:hypothetical protein
VPVRHRFAVLIRSTYIYRVVQNTLHTDHSRLQSCINMDGGYFENFSRIRLIICAGHDIYKDKHVM